MPASPSARCAPLTGALRALLAAVALAGCTCEAPPPSVFIHAPEELPEGVRMAVDDLVADLERIGGFTVTRAAGPVPACRGGEIRVVVSGEVDATLARQSFAVDESRCDGDGRRWVLRGGSVLSLQWAIYAVAEQAGVLYLHPEQTLYPARARWSEKPLGGVHAPAFQRRTMNVHRTHPVELSAPLDPSGIDMAAYQRRWIDWTVKIRQSFTGAWDSEFVGDYAWRRGFGREAGINLLNAQQGGRPIIDPDSPDSEEDQIARAIDARMAPAPGVPPVEVFGCQFNPSEFTEANEHDTVRRLTFLANYFDANYSGVDLNCINHGTHGKPTPDYGVRFFDLSKFAPPRLGVKVHPLMFYDLERPAPVYGNEDFVFLRDFIVEQAPIRRIIYYPEGSWWLTFDLPVPLYLAPVTLEARQYDMDLLAGMVVRDPESPTGVYGHHLFTSGQEWGYWLVDWCVARMAWDLSYTHESCLAEFTGALARGGEILAVLREVERRQVTDMRDPEIIRLLVGSDDATEAAFDAGIVFHPLPPSPSEVVAFDDAAAAKLQAASVEPMRAIAADYHRWADRIEAVLAAQSAAQAPWVREIRDGLRAFALRAELAAEVYETALALRAALKANDLDGVKAAHPGLDRARAVVERARAVVRAREADYRYPPELTIAGDEAGTPGALPNKTVYTYRYLSRTHRLFFWERPVKQLGELFGEGLEVVRVNRRILREGTALEIALLAESVGELRIDYGDGTTSEELSPHVYGAQGIYDWTLNARIGAAALFHEDRAAVVQRRFVFPKGSLKVEEPRGAALVAGLLPGFEVGLGADSAAFLVMGSLESAEELSARGSLVRRAREGNRTVESDLDLPFRNVGSIRIRESVIEVADGAGENARRLEIRGRLQTDEIIDLLVQVGGFEHKGARQTVADVLGETPETLPEAVDFLITAKGREEI